MSVFLCFSGVTFLLALLLWFTFLKVEVFFCKDREQDHGSITFSIFGFIRYRVDIQKLQWKGIKEGIDIKLKANSTEEHGQVSLDSMERARHTYQEILERVAHFHQQVVRWVLQRVICDHFSWKTKIGTGEAHETGIITGIAWGIKTSLIGFVGSSIQWEKVPVIDVTPSFQHMQFETHFHMIIRFRIGNAIKGVCRFIIQLVKGSAFRWRNILSKV